MGDESGGKLFSRKGLPSAPFLGNGRELFEKSSRHPQKLLKQMEKMRRRDAKRNGETAIKVFAPLFSKSGTFPRSPIGVSFSLAFSLRLWLQRKSGWKVCERERERRKRREPFSGKGLPSAPFPRSRGNVHTTFPKALEQKEKTNRHDAKRNGETAIKVFAPLFSKSGTFPSFSYRRFFFLSFFFAPLASKKKRLKSLQKRTGETKAEGTLFGKRASLRSVSALTRKRSHHLPKSS